MARIEFKPNPAAAANGIKFPGGGNVSASLQTLQDPGNNSLPIAVSTSQVSFGGATSAARVAVRGDGTNSIVRFEDNAGLRILEINQAGFFNVSNASSFVGWYAIDNNLAANKNGFGIGFTNVMQNGNSYYFTTALSKNATSGTSTLIKTAETFAASAGSANYRHLDVGYTINNSGAQTGVATGIFLNATETALNGMTHNLIDLQVGSASRFKVSNGGSITSGNLSSGALTTAAAFRVGSRAAITEAGLTALGLTVQIAIEHNGTVYYVPVSASQFA